MQNNMSFSLDYKKITLDEIALEGLEGIVPDLLWRRIEKRISLPVTDKMKERFWHFIVHSKDINIYKLPKPVEPIEIIDRFTVVDEDSGQLKDPGKYLDGPYEYSPVENEYGSCKNYATRLLIPNEKLNQFSYYKLALEYGNRIAFVASIEERWQALANHVPIVYLYNLTPIHYCILELVGKSRENGQMTIGTTNIVKVVKESKTMFYNRKTLQDLDLVRVQYITQVLNGKGIKSLLLRLKRFHQPKILSMPKVGKLRQIVDYLLTKPDFCEKTDVMISKGLMTQPQSKRLRNTVNIFNFTERLVDEDQKSKPMKRRYIAISKNIDESISSDEEINEPPLKCQFKIGVNLLRQAYEQFMSAGLKGLTQVQLAQLLGIEFYTSRNICRILRSQHLVREFLEDKGRQRTARFIAVASTGKMDKTYAEEQKKFLEHLNESNLNENEPGKVSEKPKVVAETREPDIKVEMDIDTERKVELKPDNLQNNVTEIKVLPGFENMKVKSLHYNNKNLSLRQLKFANGLLKVVKEKVCVCGYLTLSDLVATETGEPKMDAKCLKSFLQKLVNSGHLKMFSVKWPGFQHKYSNFICAPHIKPTDPIIKAKYKEISIRAASNKKVKIKREHLSPLSLSQMTLPRYMKIQKLHEFLMMFAYFNPIKAESHDFPQGFLSVVDIIPEFTVEFVIGNISHPNTISLDGINLDDDILSSKLRDAPPDLYKILLECRGFHATIRYNLKVLAMLGLIQLIYQSAVQTADHNNCGPTSLLLYVNRSSKIIDTTGTWPRPNVDKKLLEKTFYFENFEDVKMFWVTVHNISVCTNIQSVQRSRKRLTPPLRMPNEVHNFNNGENFCDGLGPCGFDSSFFMDLSHLWNSLTTKISKAQKVQKKAIKLPKLENKKQRKKIKKSANIKTSNKVKISVQQAKRKRLCESNSTKWTKKEDHMIMLCKTAISIISPVSQPGCLTLRNTVIKDLLCILDPNKTKMSGHKRAMFLDSDSTLQHEKECLLNEMRRRRSLMEKYDGLLKKLRHRYSGNMTKYINEARLPMLELVWILSQLSDKKILLAKIPCVATDIETFNENFTINCSTANVSCNIYQDPEYALLKEAMIMTTFLSVNNSRPDVGRIIYTTYKKYPENTLRIALDQLRKCGAIAAKEKVLNNIMHRFCVGDMIKTSYKISMNYQRRWINRLNSEFVDKLGSTIESAIPQANFKGSSELNCLMLETITSDLIEILSTTIPVIIDCSGTSIIQEEQLNVIDIETKYSLKSGTLGWNGKHNFKSFIDLFKDSFEYEKSLKTLKSASTVNIIGNSGHVENDIILKHLKEKGENGSTFAELAIISHFNDAELLKKLEKWEEQNIIKRVGFYENIIILIEFVEKWTVKLGQTSLIPTPWISLNATICYDILFKWSGVIMNRVFESPGCSVSYLVDASEFLSARSVQDICIFLRDNKCVLMNTLKVKEVDLFSDDEYIADITDYNQYESIHNVIVYPVVNALTRYAYLKKVIFDKYCN